MWTVVYIFWNGYNIANYSLNNWDYQEERCPFGCYRLAKQRKHLANISEGTSSPQPFCLPLEAPWAHIQHSGLPSQVFITGQCPKYTGFHFCSLQLARFCQEPLQQPPVSRDAVARALCRAGTRWWARGSTCKQEASNIPDEHSDIPSIVQLTQIRSKQKWMFYFSSTHFYYSCTRSRAFGDRIRTDLEGNSNQRKLVLWLTLMKPGLCTLW